MGKDLATGFLHASEGLKVKWQSALTHIDMSLSIYVEMLLSRAAFETKMDDPEYLNSRFLKIWSHKQ